MEVIIWDINKAGFLRGEVGELRVPLLLSWNQAHPVSSVGLCERNSGNHSKATIYGTGWNLENHLIDDELHGDRSFEVPDS